ncbi:MAG: hypothetical protein NT076_00840 [Candidatus Pacearchaeota archaeon]|nr:hypothetical protein [Candidatus Pacearchaeota archaeon]
MAMDISGLSFFMPLFGFLLVFTIMLALLLKTKLLGENKFVNIVISFIIAIIFATMTNVREYVQNVTPWFVVLVIALFFILIIVGLYTPKVADVVKPGFVWIFIIALILVFLIAAVTVFSSFSGIWSDVTNFVTNEARIAGAIILLIIAVIAAWVITKK